MLLVEDDEGDAFLVTEMLREQDPRLKVRVARSVAAARTALQEDPADCVLLDLGLPDAYGLSALEDLRDVAQDVALLVLTGDGDVQRGVAAVAAGAQDYLVKGVDGDVLLRAVRYAVERLQADAVRQELAISQLRATEATRLERGLLPVPVVDRDVFGVGSGYRPGRERTLLGGDFYDAVQTPDGALHAVVGDVSGHGPDEAALGVCLRVAWRTQVLGAADPDQILVVLQSVLEHERHDPDAFATLTAVTVAPDRTRAEVRNAGHPPLLVLDAAGVPLVLAPPVPQLPLGVFPESRWSQITHELPSPWSLLLFTDGLLEGHAAPGAERRLGHEGLVSLVSEVAAADGAGDPDDLAARLISEVEARNGEALQDDVAVLILTGAR